MARATPPFIPKGLLAWLLTRYCMVAKFKHPQELLVMRWRNALSGLSMVIAGRMYQLQHQPAMPSLVVDADLIMFASKTCKVDRSPVSEDYWLELPLEWSLVARGSRLLSRRRISSPSALT